MKTTKRLYRTRKPDRIISGVCGGIGEYFNIDPVFMRLLYIILFVIQTPTFVILWVCQIGMSINDG